MSLCFLGPPIIMPFCIDVLLVVDERNGSESGVVRVVLLSGIVMVVRVVFSILK
jgi:hypothetical protein